MLMEKLASIIGAIPQGREDIVYVITCLVFLYILDSFISFLKIAFKGLK